MAVLVLAGMATSSVDTALMASGIVALEPRRINHCSISATHGGEHHVEVNSCTNSPDPKVKAVNNSYLLLDLIVCIVKLWVNTCISLHNIA